MSQRVVESAGKRNYDMCFSVHENVETQTHAGHPCSITGNIVPILGPHCLDHSVVTDLEGPLLFFGHCPIFWTGSWFSWGNQESWLKFKYLPLLRTPGDGSGGTHAQTVRVALF